MTTDPRTFTLEQCCDFLAECKGWKIIIQHPPECYESERQVWYNGTAWRSNHHHPIPANLDSISKALPESWVWCVIQFADDGVYVSCHPRGKCSEESAFVMWKAADELLTRAIICCLAWQSVKGEG